MRLWGFVVLILFGAHVWTMSQTEPGLVDLTWICNSMSLVEVFLLLIRFHQAANAAVFFWTAYGGIVWAIFLCFVPDEFRMTSLVSHLLVPTVSFAYLRPLPAPRQTWKWVAGFGEITFLLFVLAHPQVQRLYLFDFDSAARVIRILATMGLHAAYGALIAGSHLAFRRLGWVA